AFGGSVADAVAAIDQQPCIFFEGVLAHMLAATCHGFALLALSLMVQSLLGVHITMFIFVAGSSAVTT
ncbi:hypothetical protein CICLE_v10010232mg, partial [Citrus x clementina]